MELAKKYLLRALEGDADHPEANYNLGLLWEKQGVGSKALEYYRRFAARASESSKEVVEELRRRFPELE